MVTVFWFAMVMNVLSILIELLSSRTLASYELATNWNEARAMILKRLYLFIMDGGGARQLPWYTDLRWSTNRQSNARFEFLLPRFGNRWKFACSRRWEERLRWASRWKDCSAIGEKDDGGGVQEGDGLLNKSIFVLAGISAIYSGEHTWQFSKWIVQWRSPRFWSVRSATIWIWRVPPGMTISKEKPKLTTGCHVIQKSKSSHCQCHPGHSRIFEV